MAAFARTAREKTVRADAAGSSNMTSCSSSPIVLPAPAHCPGRPEPAAQHREQTRLARTVRAGEQQSSAGRTSSRGTRTRPGTYRSLIRMGISRCALLRRDTQ